VDLVEIAATATPPVCRLVDFGKFRYEQSKKEKESKKKSSGMHHSSAAAAASSAGHIPEVGHAPKAGEHDSKPGPAWKTVGGTVKHIDNNAYTVEDYEGNQVKLYVGQGTKVIKQKKVGDTVRAEITRGGFANSVQ